MRRRNASRETRRTTRRDTHGAMIDRTFMKATAGAFAISACTVALVQVTARAPDICMASQRGPAGAETLPPHRVCRPWFPPRSGATDGCGALCQTRIRSAHITHAAFLLGIPRTLDSTSTRARRQPPDLPAHWRSFCRHHKKLLNSTACVCVCVCVCASQMTQHLRNYTHPLFQVSQSP